MRKIFLSFFLMLALVGTSHSANKEKVRVGYWTSGVSLGFGAVLEAKQFLENQGLEVEYVRFPDLSAQSRALVSGSIDITFGNPLTATFSAVNQGVPIKIVGATQLADAYIVARQDSPINSLKDLRGKKVGGTSNIAAVTLITNAILEERYGIRSDEFTLIAGNESRLVQFLAQKQVDASILRAVTLEQVGNELKLKKLGYLVDEWQKITKTKAVPYIGISAATESFVTKHPEIVAKVLKAFLQTEKWGNENKEEVIKILQQRANLPEKDARAFANRWGKMYRLSLDPATVSTLKQQHKIFLKGGVIKGKLNDNLFVTGPYKKAITLK